MQSEFLRLLSHELRTPLTGIRGYSDLLCDEQVGPLTDRQRQMLTMLNSCVHRLDSLVDDLLLVASVDAGLYGLVVEDLDLFRLCEQAVRERAAHARPDEPGLHLEYTTGSCPVKGDPRQLLHLVTALLNHAVAGFTGTAGLRLDDDGGSTVALVTHGTPADLLHDPAGLGLAVVRAVAEHHGGTVEAQPGCVRVELPKVARAGARVVERPRRVREH